MNRIGLRPGTFKSNMLVVQLLLAPIFLDLVTANSTFTYALKFSAVLFAIAIREQSFQVSESEKSHFLLLLMIAMILISANFVNAVSFQPNILFNLFWFWYLRDQLWFRNVFLQSILFSLQILGVTSILTTLTSLLPQFTKLQSTNYFVPLNDLLGLQYRQQGVFTHPNTYALFSFMLIGLSIVVKKRMSVIWISVGLFGLLTSGSRTFQLLSLLILAFSVVEKIFGTFFLSKKSRIYRFPIIYLGVIAYFFILLFTSNTKLSPESLTGRYGIWSQSITAMDNHLFFGLGTDYSLQLIQRGVLPNYANSAHSLYLEALLSGGIMGGILALGLFYTMFRRIRPVGGALFLLFVLILVAGVTETMFSLASFGVMNLFFAYAFSFSEKDIHV